MSSVVWWPSISTSPSATHGQVDRAVARDLIEHVRQEGQGRLDLGDARAVEVHLDADLRLFGLAFDLGDTRGHFSSSTFQAACSRTSSIVPPAP